MKRKNMISLLLGACCISGCTSSESVKVLPDIELKKMWGSDQENLYVITVSVSKKI